MVFSDGEDSHVSVWSAHLAGDNVIMVAVSVGPCWFQNWLCQHKHSYVARVSLKLSEDARWWL